MEGGELREVMRLELGPLWGVYTDMPPSSLGTGWLGDPEICGKPLKGGRAVSQQKAQRVSRALHMRITQLLPTGGRSEPRLRQGLSSGQVQLQLPLTCHSGQARHHPHGPPHHHSSRGRSGVSAS